MTTVVQPETVFDPDIVFGARSYRQRILVGHTHHIAGQAAIDSPLLYHLQSIGRA